MSTITIKVDLRKMFGPIRDQRQRPTCLVFAASDLHACLRGPWSPLSCEYLFYHAQRRTSRPPNVGATLTGTLEALEKDGQPHETGWPYLDQFPADVSTWVPPVNVGPLFRRAGEPGTDTMGAIIAEIDQGRTVLILLRLSTSFDWVGADGIVDQKPGESPDPLRRHAVIVVGHGEVDGRRAVLIRNSWGPGWGASGYGWLTEDFLTPRVFKLAVLKEEIGVPTNTIAT